MGWCHSWRGKSKAISPWCTTLPPSFYVRLVLQNLAHDPWQDIGLSMERALYSHSPEFKFWLSHYPVMSFQDTQPRQQDYSCAKWESYCLLEEFRIKQRSLRLAESRSLLSVGPPAFSPQSRDFHSSDTAAHRHQKIPSGPLMPKGVCTARIINGLPREPKWEWGRRIRIAERNNHRRL